LLGQAEVNASHSSALVMAPAPAPPSHGSANWRAENSAPKNAPKDMTSEKMNEVIPSRKGPSTWSLERRRTDSRMRSPNQPSSTPTISARPNRHTTMPQGASLSHAPAPTAAVSSAMEPKNGQRLLGGT